MFAISPSPTWISVRVATHQFAGTLTRETLHPLAHNLARVFGLSERSQRGGCPAPGPTHDAGLVDRTQTPLHRLAILAGGVMRGADRAVKIGCAPVHRRKCESLVGTAQSLVRILGPRVDVAAPEPCRRRMRAHL